MRRSIGFLVVVAGFAGLAAAPLAHAAGVVSPCTEANLRTALKGAAW
jgi:hypothetical protein